MPFVYQVSVRNVNEALPRGLRVLAGSMSLTEQSRNGPVRVAPGPVMTTYDKPTERVLFSPMRNANPFFHLFESLWMLAGRNDLPWLAQFNKQMATYSDDGGKTQPAAYGHRWREYFGYDQLEAVVAELKQDPTSRRAVLAMWDGGFKEAKQDVYGLGDIGRAITGSKDVPCNTHCYFRVRGGALDMTVMCRSNDILWGAYGANAVHFSILQEYVASKLGLWVGKLFQLSNNFHYYEDVVKEPYIMAQSAEATDYYTARHIRPMPMFEDVELFDKELPDFMTFASADGLTAPELQSRILSGVAIPMRMAWTHHKAKDYAKAEAACGDILADDWRLACREWIERRAMAHREKTNG